jgi:hypothetical protein
MIIQHYPDELDYVNAQLHPLVRREDDKSFLAHFLRSCLAADSLNYEIIRPALHELMVKYPPDPERWAMERHDRGVNP